MKDLKNSFHPYAMLTILFWSLPYVLTRLTVGHFSAFSLGFLRYLVASAALGAVAVVTKMPPPKSKDLPLFAASGGVGFFLYMIAFNQGQASLSAATGSVIIATVPVITALLARLLYHERLRACQWAAIGVEFAGVALLTLLDGVFSVNSGLWWMFAAALLLSTYNLLQRRLTQSYPALQATTYSIFAGTLLLSIFAPAAAGQLLQAPPIQYLYIAVMGVGSSAIAYVAWAVAFSKAKQMSQVSNYMFITPFLASILGFIIAGEIPDRATALGGSVILLGVLLFNFGGKLVDKAK